MINYFQKNDHFAAECGAVLTVCEPGHAEMTLTLERRHTTDVGRPHVHAGILYTLAESASAAAILPFGYNCYAVEGHITYMDAVSEGTVTAVAKGKDEHDKESGSCRVRLLAEDGRVIAKAVFTIFYTGDRFETASDDC